MTTSCENVRELIAAEGASALAEGSEAEAHVTDCEACCAFVEALAEVDHQLGSLAPIEAPNAAVEKLLARVADGEVLEATVARILKPRRWLRVAVAGGAIAAGFVIIAVITTATIMRAPQMMMASGPAERKRAVVTSQPSAAKVEAAQGAKGKSFGWDEGGRRPDLLPGKDALKTPPAEKPAAIEEQVYRQEPGDKTIGALSGAAKEQPPATAAEPANAEVVDVTLEVPGYVADRKAITIDIGSALSFLEPHGYWANTYLPGDPTLRALAARLGEVRRRGVLPAGLDDVASPPPQPFDPPRGSALALYVHADRTGVEGETRALLQVGLKGAAVHGRRRPSMNVGLVIDAGGELSIEEAKSIRAIASAFVAHKAPGDRFSITVAGRPGAMIVAPEQFRAGTVAAAIDALFAGGVDQRPSLSLTEAIERAIGSVIEANDETTPLGASAVILIGAGPIAELERVRSIAGSSAIGGVSVSVFAAGARMIEAEMEAIGLAGQGSKRWVTAAADANAAVERELALVGRAVARAVRIDIRLASKVKLVEVIGSQRLDARETARVKRAEESIDQKLARSMGISADRGKDDAGIQILIPAFYADDAHVILLDVVVDGPGPVVEVTAKYKDLVRLQNGTARAKLELGKRPVKPGPLEQNVVANRVAFEVSKRLAAAAENLRAGDLAAMRVQLDQATALLGTIERDLAVADQQMIAAYARLAEAWLGDAERRSSLADSLAYAAMLERQPRPKE